MNNTVWFNVAKYVEQAKRMNAQDTIRNLVISSGSHEAKENLLDMANRQLDPDGQEESEIDAELNELSSMYTLMFTQARGGMTKDMKEVGKRIDYLKTLKALGRKTDG